MVCSECQTREAQVFFKQILNNQVSQRALCQDCAQRIAGMPSTAPDTLLMQVLAGLGNLLSKSPLEPRKPLGCASCGLKYARFQETGRLGCADCYESFRTQLADLLRRVHGSGHHRGKLPKGSREVREREHRKEELAMLKRALKAAIEEERFEEAAALRDQIQRLS